MLRLPPREKIMTAPAIPPQAADRPRVTCFGEILWDILPSGRFPGGAPMNVAYHLQMLGLEPVLVSAVGRDPNGDELRRILDRWGLDQTCVRRHTGFPTGTVRATLSAGGEPAYNIARDVAWDHLIADAAAVRRTQAARALVFGSLAQRSAANRATLERLLSVLPLGADRIFDVNLRPPHDDLDLVRALAARATILKLNAAEAARLAEGGEETPGKEADHARLLAETFGCAAVVVTCGARGAGVWLQDRWFWEVGRPVQVADTVGAGDAFLAAFISGWLRGAAPAACLAAASRLGEWVASRPGATPVYAAR